jgi:hypothetical protein
MRTLTIKCAPPLKGRMVKKAKHPVPIPELADPCRLVYAA